MGRERAKVIFEETEMPGVRVYDGVAVSPSRKVIGIEVKSGTGKLTPAQRAFDTRLNSSRFNTARGFGMSSNITIHRALEVRR